MAEKDLRKLLSAIEPCLHTNTFVFCKMSEEQFRQLAITPQCLFREEEALTVVIEQAVADRLQLPYSNCWALITCKVNSDLTAVGFLAAMSSVLAEANIPVNAVSAYFHDHLFVPKDLAKQAVTLLQLLAAAQK